MLNLKLRSEFSVHTCQAQLLRYAAMREADFAGTRHAPAADQAGMTDRVVWRAEGPLTNQRRAGREHVSHAVNARDLQ